MTALAPMGRDTRPGKTWLRNVPFEIKSFDEAERTFRGLASTAGLDLGNDIVEPGAFKRTLDHWQSVKAKRPISLLNGHNAWDIQNVVGKLIDASETGDGLDTAFQLLPPGDLWGDGAYVRVKGGFVTGLSMGYSPVQWEMERRDGKMIRHLREVKLHEISLVVFPMNEDARVDTASVKHWLAGTLTDAEKAAIRELPEEQKQELRALLEPEDPASAPAPEALLKSIQARLLRLKIRQLATQADALGPAPGDRTLITEVSDHGNDCGKAA